MPLSRDQIVLIKRAQSQAGVTDEEYRATWPQLTGWEDCHSSKDPRLTDKHVDRLLGYFEALYWSGVDRGELPAPSFKQRLQPVFQQRGYWAGKNQRGNTSRDRYTENELKSKMSALETQLHRLGYGLRYIQAIQNRIQPFSARAYIAALTRTIESKRRKQTSQKPS
jgi:hypothetical protein